MATTNDVLDAIRDALEERVNMAMHGEQNALCFYNDDGTKGLAVLFLSSPLAEKVMSFIDAMQGEAEKKVERMPESS